MKKFLVLFLTPVAVLENWMNTPAEDRKEMEDTMQVEWKEWMTSHADAFVEVPAGAGKTKVVGPNGVADTKNDIMMYGLVQAESHEAAAEMFVGHPHFQIPEATIQVMTINELTGMN